MSEIQRKLAAVKRIDDIQPIAGADAIEAAIIGGYTIVVKKTEGLKKGDLCVYFEVDSILPERPEFEFMSKYRYRLKTIKLRGCVSQGLIIPLNGLPELSAMKLKEDMDLTDVLKVKKYESPDDLSGKADLEERKRRGPLARFAMSFALIRTIHKALYGKEKGDFPQFIGGKTDEENVQSVPRLLRELENERLYVTEKMEGQSYSAFVRVNRNGLLNKLFTPIEFGVASHSVWKKTDDGSTWWLASKQEKVEDKLKQALKETGKEYAIQAELCGGKVQGNIYKFDKYRLFIFNVYNITDQKILDYVAARCFCDKYGLEFVPVLHENFSVKGKTAIDLVNMADGASVFQVDGKEIAREGLVIRSVNDPKAKSFKAKSTAYLLKNEK